jgi:hypothetical protein
LAVYFFTASVFVSDTIVWILPFVNFRSYKVNIYPIPLAEFLKFIRVEVLIAKKKQVVKMQNRAICFNSDFLTPLFGDINTILKT